MQNPNLTSFNDKDFKDYTYSAYIKQHIYVIKTLLFKYYHWKTWSKSIISHYIHNNSKLKHLFFPLICSLQNVKYAD